MAEGGRPSQPPKGFRFGEFTLDVGRRRLERGDLEIALQPKVFSTLVHLLEHAGRVVSKDELLSRVWTDAHVGDGALARCIKEIREALGDDARSPVYVRTAPRVGYAFIAEVEVQMPSPSRVDEVRSAAVLPFKPLLSGGRDPSLELGMADTLILRLSNLHNLAVRPLSAVRHYTDLDQDPIEAGREQTVAAVVEGGVQRSGDLIRVSVRLLRVEDGVALLAERFEGRFEDVFSLQDSICGRIAAALSVRLSQDESDRMARRPTQNGAAYRDHLRGRLALGRRTAEGARRAIASFERALAADPDYADAHVGMADALESLGTLGVEPAHYFEPARRAAEAALALDPGLAAAWCALGRIAWQYDWDWAAADRAFARARELAPNDAEVCAALSDYEAIVGDADASLAAARRALELDPASPWANTLLAQALYMAERFEDAIAQTQRTLARAPGFAYALFFQGLSCLGLGREDDAIAALEEARETSDRPDFTGILAMALARAGRAAEAEACFEAVARLLRDGEEAPAIATAARHFVRGELEQALDGFERAFEARSWHVLLLAREPLLGELRPHPRGKTLLGKLGLPRATRDPG